MRPMPNVDSDSDSTADTPHPKIEELTERSLENLRVNSDGDIETAVVTAINGHHSQLPAPSSIVKQAVSKQIEDQLPEAFEYELEHDIEEGWMIQIVSGCPNCGNEAIFNGTLKTSNQWVGRSGYGDKQMCSIDDSTRQELEFLACGTCPEILVDNRDG